jgi:hypothetical protein
MPGSQTKGKIVVVGGPGRNAGKTTLVCALLRAFPEFRWIAVKVTVDDHRFPSPCWEQGRGGAKGASRYLEAGAERSFILTAKEAVIPLELLWERIEPGANLIFESNRILQLLQPDLCLAVLGPGKERKPSFAPFLERAQAVLAPPGISERLPLNAAQSRFPVQYPEPLSPEFLAFVRRALYS